MFHITSKYLSFFNNKPPASWVAHITGDFLICYSCSYCSSMIYVSYFIVHSVHFEQVEPACHLRCYSAICYPVLSWRSKKRICVMSLIMEQCLIGNSLNMLSYRSNYKSIFTVEMLILHLSESHCNLVRS